MEKVNIDNNTYEIIKNYKSGFVKEDFISLCTDYFYDYDYIVGDWAYGKLRLKGFYEKNNKKCKPINNFDMADEYIKNNCAFDCKYFIAKRNI